MTKFSDNILNFSDTVNDACSYVLHNSASNNAPYHNFYHIMTVTINCHAACDYYKFDKNPTEVLLIAALFHDFSHTMGKEKDDVNIKIAVEGMQKWAQEFKYTGDVESIARIIKATEFPYKIESNKLSIRQQIIRDADMTQCLHDNWIQQIIFGLGQEMKKTPEEMIKGQKAFFESIKPATKWFEGVWTEKKDGLLKELELLNKTYSIS